MSANNVDGALIMDTAVENCLHWVMEMVFRDDECRVRTENAPANFTTLKHIGAESDQKIARQGLAAPKAQNRRLGRRFSRKPHRRWKPSPDSPGISPHSPDDALICCANTTIQA